MGDRELSRRRVLSTLATAGAAGTMVGSGTSALFTDQETLADNTIGASGSVAGNIDLTVDRTVVDETTNEYEFDVELPSGATKNNPAYVWVRLAECPAPEFASDLELSLSVKCGDRSVVEFFQNEPFGNVAEELRNGYPLDPRCNTQTPGDQDCFEPGDSVTVVLNATVDSSGGGGGELTFEFRARQCRYRDGTSNPFPSVGGCPTSTDPEGKAISFVAFCTSENGPINPEIVDELASDEDGPTAVKWETDVGVEHVVLKAGQQCKLYSYQNKPTQGTVDSDPTGEGESVGCNPPAPCGEDFDGASAKLEYDEADDEFVEED